MMREMRPSLARVAPLLFTSGACSLVYETVWLRELRLVFGASTTASAAVVACFVGGLGVGGLVLGRRADRHPRPLALYGNLEAGIAVSAACTPLLLELVRAVYIGVGGTRMLGATVGSALRLLLAALVFAAPTLLMGGTLPAVARAIETDDDHGRRGVARLYGINTLGAVTGCMLSTFALFEVFGTRITLWIACLFNALVAVAARNLARSSPDLPAPTTPEEQSARPRSAVPDAPPWFTLSAAAVAGFTLCLMELVWYRMLGPLLGGSVFTFGLILALVLLGIGAGGVVYGLRPRHAAATVHAFAWTCILEAVLVAVPYALGDRLAVLAVMLRPVGDLSFWLNVATWTLVACVVVLPASFVSGVQFPLLVGMLGRGDRDVGRDVGRVYATNTAGAIAGSLAGGFGLIPALTAPGCWRFAVWSLLALGVVAVLLGARSRPLAALVPALLGVVAAVLVGATGPTAAWRHSPIGVGHVDAVSLRSPNRVTAWEHSRRHAIAWETDGRESSVALDRAFGLTFVVNGKNDGNARTDAATTVMLGMVGATLHPHPTSAMVIGLGTGETAGWLGAINAMETVDVAEIEPAMLEVARRCAPMNHDAMGNPKVHVEIGDARELLLTSQRRYSLVASEPSNPYRAGVASLFTRSYYQAIQSRLEDDGIFLQWLQGYEVDAGTVRTVYATLASVFPEVETWQLLGDDLLLVASMKPVPHDVPRMQARLREEPYRSAAGLAWRAADVEGFLAHFVASSALAREVARQDTDRVNTDDLNIVEFGFARNVGVQSRNFALDDVRRVASARGEARPTLVGGEVDWDVVEEVRVAAAVAQDEAAVDHGSRAPARGHRIAAIRAFEKGDTRTAVSEWGAQPEEPRGSAEPAMIAMALADLGDETATRYDAALRSFLPAEADAVLARLRVRQGRLDEATRALESVFVELRRNGWPLGRLVKAAFSDAQEIALRAPRLADRLYSALAEPFAVRVFDSAREELAFAIALRTHGPACVAAASVFEPDVPWTIDFLRARHECYRATHDPRAGAAERDLRDFLASTPTEFAAGLAP